MRSVPLWLKDMPSLKLLDISGNSNINLTNITALTQLETLVLQNLDLSQPMVRVLRAVVFEGGEKGDSNKTARSFGVGGAAKPGPQPAHGGGAVVVADRKEGGERM